MEGVVTLYYHCEIVYRKMEDGYVHPGGRRIDEPLVPRLHMLPMRIVFSKARTATASRQNHSLFISPELLRDNSIDRQCSPWTLQVKPVPQQLSSQSLLPSSAVGPCLFHSASLLRGPGSLRYHTLHASHTRYLTAVPYQPRYFL